MHARLAHTRWTDAVAGAGWSYGVDVAYVQEVVQYWQHTYDWRTHETALNAFHQFKAEVDGVTIHFIHERGTGPNPTPILLTHGWPDSFYRFHKIIPMLTNPEQYGGTAADLFDVIVPSIPGFGFSDRTAMSSSAVADLWAKLMTALGYTHFVAAGGDVGSGVTKELALRHPQQVSAIHLTDVGYPTGQEDVSTMSEAEQQFAGVIQDWWFAEGAYADQAAIAGGGVERFACRVTRVDAELCEHRCGLQRRRGSIWRARRTAHQHHDLLGHRHNWLVGTDVCRRCPRRVESGGRRGAAQQRTRWHHAVPPRGTIPARMGRAQRQCAALHHHATWRALCAAGGAGVVRCGGACVLPSRAVSVEFHGDAVCGQGVFRLRTASPPIHRAFVRVMQERHNASMTLPPSGT